MKKAIGFIILFLVINSIVNSAFAQEIDMVREIIYKSRIHVSGYFSAEYNKNTWFGITVKDGMTGKVVLNLSDDETVPYLIKECDKGISVISLCYIPDSVMKGLKGVPLSLQPIIISQDNVILDSVKFCFKQDMLNKEQELFILKLCRDLVKYIEKPKQEYPFDEFSVYALFFGAIHNIDPAKKLFEDLDELFVLDGAIKETKDEIPYSYILDNRNR